MRWRLGFSAENMKNKLAIGVVLAAMIAVTLAPAAGPDGVRPPVATRALQRA